MQIEHIMAAVAVTDMERAEAFYTDLFGTGPTTRPMDGLIEFHVAAGGVLQVTVDPDRAGGSVATLVVDALDDADARTSAGAAFEQLTDPDGNGITLLAQ